MLKAPVMKSACAFTVAAVLTSVAPQLVQAQDADAATTTVLATDLDSIAARFTQIDNELNGLRTRYDDLASVVSQVAGTANLTDIELNQTETELSTVQTLASTNRVNAQALETTFTATQEKMDEAKKEMANLQGVVNGVETQALTMAHATKDVSTNVGELELAVKDLLPGKDFLPGRIKKAQDFLEKYTKEAEAGDLDKLVASKVRGNFVRTQGRMETLAAEATRAQESGGSEDDF